LRSSTSRSPTRAAWAALFLAAAGCGGIGSRIARLPDDAPARGWVVLPRPVTLPRSRLTSDCGPETLCAVINYWGRPASVQELSRLVRDPKMQGIPSNDMILLAQAKGLRADPVAGSVGRIKRAVDRAVPPIVMVEAGGGLFHFFVVTGYNDREQAVVCEEYDDSKRLIGYAELETLWEKPRHFMLELEVSKADDYYQQAANLEAEGLPREAAVLHRKALEADPGHYEARVGLGNCLLYQGRLEDALAEYLRAKEASPSDPRVLNNLANVYLELKREIPEAERLAGKAVDGYDAEHRRVRAEIEAETQPAVRAARQRELGRAQRDLAHALGTLGQARSANGHPQLAIAAWKGSYDHFPLTEFDFRAKRQYEIGLAFRALEMPAEARGHLERALAEAKDPALLEKIRAALR
jgi:tetratricopeptide (TPR) repeat protein